MLLEEGLYTFLQSRAGLTALVGTRIYPVMAPQGVALPYVAFDRVDTRPEQALGEAAGLATTRVQFDCYAAGAKQAKELADALRQALDGQSGTWGSVVVGACLWLNELDVYEPETGSYAVPVDFDVIYEMTPP